MSIAINPHNYFYEPSVFQHPSKWYDSYQENGTKYLKSRKPLEEELKQQLNACSGEIFLSGIPSETGAEKIAEIAALLGEIYILRFKVNFSGNSRGFAYLQYMNPNLMQTALISLPSLFRKYGFTMLKVRESRNSSKLLLKKTYRMSPVTVFETLKKLTKFQKLVGYETYPGYFEYQIIFRCNEEAVHGRRELLKSISTFGRNAIVVWDIAETNNNYNNYNSYINNYNNYNNNAAIQGINFTEEFISNYNIQQSASCSTTSWLPNNVQGNRPIVSNLFQASNCSPYTRFPTQNSVSNNLY